MKTKNGEGKTRKGEKFVAFFLIAGGLLGVIAAVAMGLHFAKEGQTLRACMQIIAAGLFLLCIVTGTALWRDLPGALKSSQILFALQVPAFSLARFSYEFSALFSIRLMIGDTTHNIGANIGSSLNLNLLQQPVGFMFGVNIIAVTIFLYLIKASLFELVHKFSDKSREVAHV